jgi:cell wall-associated NlpC family hydrolase
MSEPGNLTLRRAVSPVPFALAAAVTATLIVVLSITLGGSRHRGTAAAPAQPAAHVAAEAPDPLAAQSYPVARSSLRHASASAPRAAGRESFISPGAPSDQQIRALLREEQAIQKAAADQPLRVVVDPRTGVAIAPVELPLRIQEVIAGGNAIRDFPYVYGGGHRSFIDDAYDCSGSVSYALAAGGLIGAPETSGQLEHWGKPGPGRYLTVFANAGHTFMYVDGVWFDTAGRAGPYSTRWLTARPSLAGYAVRHYPGL